MILVLDSLDQTLDELEAFSRPYHVDFLTTIPVQPVTLMITVGLVAHECEGREERKLTFFSGNHIM